MLILVRLGLRNLLRHFRRSLITIFSIGFGLGVILWLQAILNGSNASVIRTITSTYHGHLQIFRKDYLATKMIQYSFKWDKKTIPQLPGTEISASPRVHLPALVSSGEQSVPVVLEGIDPQLEPKITKIKENLVEGKFLPNESAGKCNRSAYISQALSKLLNVRLNEKIVVMAQAADGSLGNELYFVRGLFNSGSPDYDRSVVISTLPCVQAIGSIRGVHEVALSLKGDATAEDLQKAIIPNLSQNETALTWRQVNPRLATITKYNDASLFIVVTILFVVIGLGILNTFLVMVFERTREFGVMMALGTSARGVVGTVLAEGFFLGLAASILGIVVAAIAIAYHSRVGFDLRPLVGEDLSVSVFKLELTIYPIINWLASLKATALTMFIVVVSCAYPAIRAARLKPAVAIRSV